jgi:hypothetical protein
MKSTQFFLTLVKLLPILVATLVITGLLLPAESARAASSVYGLPLPILDEQAHITDGIMGWGLLIVAIIFAGTWLGSRAASKRTPKHPKQK